MRDRVVIAAWCHRRKNSILFIQLVKQPRAVEVGVIGHVVPVVVGVVTVFVVVLAVPVSAGVIAIALVNYFQLLRL